MVRCYISCTLDGIPVPRVELDLMKSNFILHCECGINTTYRSMFKTKWEEGMYLECRTCKTKYYVSIHVDIKEIKDE